MAFKTMRIEKPLAERVVDEDRGMGKGAFDLAQYLSATSQIF